MAIIFIALCLGLVSAKNLQHGPYRSKHVDSNSTATGTAGCDPDYGWISGPEGSNVCYMILRDNAFAQCFPNGGGGYPDWSCDPSNPNCNYECYNTECCYNPGYCSGGSYYSSYNWYEAMQCCVANHGYLAEPTSQEQHELIKQRLTIIDGETFTSYWLGGVDFFSEGTWQFASGRTFSFTQWHEGEPNNVDNEDCLSMSSQDSYEWMDLGCDTRDHGGVMHYAVCQSDA